MILDLAKLTAGETVTGGIVCIHTYSKKPYQTVKSYISGTLRNGKNVMAIKIWDHNLVKVFSDNDMSNKVVKISGEVKDYKGTLEINVQSISLCPDIPVSQFLQSVDVPKVFDVFADLVNSCMSEKAVSFLMGFFKAENLHERFKQEFAGTKMHDAQVGGLMNHTVKMLRLAKTLVDNDKRLARYSDLLFLGIVLHDIGKVHEYNLGAKTEHSFVTHRVFGVEMLAKYKTIISAHFDESFYYHLLAIVQGHHGAFGEPPKTVLALIVHLLDMVESATTGILDKVDSNDVSEYAGNKSVYHDGNFLVV